MYQFCATAVSCRLSSPATGLAHTRMPGSTRRIIDKMMFDVAEADGMARDLAELAHELTQNGCDATAGVLRDMCRTNRVRSLELQGKLAALIVARDR